MPIADTYVPLTTQGNGSTVDFTFNFPIISSANLRVYLELISTGEQTLQTLSTDYTVVFDDDTPGGTVTMLSAPSALYNVIRAREIPRTQTDTFKTAGGIQASVLSTALDKLTALIQDVYEVVGRAIKLPIGSTLTVTLPAPEDGKGLAWDGTTGAIKNSDFTGATGATGPTGPAGAPGIFSAIATQVEAEAGVENTAGMTPLRVAQAISALASGGSFKTGVFTRDVSTTGDQSITGVGFTPKLVIMFSGVTLLSGSWGAWDGTTNVNIEMARGDAFEYISQEADKLIYLYVNATTAAYATGKTFDADGFTITWAKDGSPTGTAHMAYIAIG